MESHLYGHFYRAYQLVHLFITHNKGLENPIMARLATALHQQLGMLYEVLLILKQQPYDQQRLRSALQVVYLSEEAAYPLFRTWKRSSRWMDLVSKEKLMWDQNVMKELQNELVLTVPIIENIYGKQEAKYVIPPLMRSQYHYHISGGM